MYFGSVRFFRHLILAVLVLLIAIPTVLCGIFIAKYNNTNEKLTNTNEKLTQVEAVVSKYNQNDNELAENLSKVLDTSFNTQMPVFQQQVDASVGEQVGSLRTSLDSSLDSRLAELDKSLKDATDASVTDAKAQLQKSMHSQIDGLRSDISTMLKTRDAALGAKLNEKIDNLSAELTQQNASIAQLMQQLEDIKAALGT